MFPEATLVCYGKLKSVQSLIKVLSGLLSLRPIIPNGKLVRVPPFPNAMRQVLLLNLKQNQNKMGGPGGEALRKLKLTDFSDLETLKRSFLEGKVYM